MKHYRPHTLHGRVILKRGNKIAGKGAAILLNKGGPGAGSSYDSVEEYKKTIDSHKSTRGMGIGGEIETKLRNLKIKPMESNKKRQTIKFSI